MINALAAGGFLFMAILFLGIASMTGSGLAWVMVPVNGLLFVLNLVVYMGKEKELKR